MSAFLTQIQGDTVQTGTRKVDPTRKIKCTTAARETIVRFQGFQSCKKNRLTNNNLRFVLSIKPVVEN